MPLFRYKALSNSGKRLSGVIDADSLQLAKERLNREKVLVTKLTLAEQKVERALSSAMLLSLTRELAQLLSAGLPLYESLLTIEEKYRRHRNHPLFLDLCDKLKGGKQLSSVLKSYPKSFDAIYISMVEAGEKTGSLPWVFNELYTLIERRQKLKKQLTTAMAYPAFLGGFCLIVVLALLLFVIPSMQELFEGRSLHPLTSLVLSMSQFLKRTLLPMTLLIASLSALATLYFRREEGKLLLQKALQKVPLLKTVLEEAALIRFCRSASILLQGGVPLVNALSTSRKVMKHSLLEQTIQKAEAALVEGKTLSSQLKHTPHVPALVSRMLSIAEETGKLPEMLGSLSDIYDDELERSLSLITTFLQPALLLILGGVIGLVILSILLPLTDVSSLITT